MEGEKAEEILSTPDPTLPIVLSDMQLESEKVARYSPKMNESDGTPSRKRLATTLLRPRKRPRLVALSTRRKGIENSKKEVVVEEKIIEVGNQQVLSPSPSQPRGCIEVEEEDSRSPLIEKMDATEVLVVEEVALPPPCDSVVEADEEQKADLVDETVCLVVVEATSEDIPSEKEKTVERLQHDDAPQLDTPSQSLSLQHFPDSAKSKDRNLQQKIHEKYLCLTQRLGMQKRANDEPTSLVQHSALQERTEKPISSSLQSSQLSTPASSVSSATTPAPSPSPSFYLPIVEISKSSSINHEEEEREKRKQQLLQKQQEERLRREEGRRKKREEREKMRKHKVAGAIESHFTTSTSILEIERTKNDIKIPAPYQLPIEKPTVYTSSLRAEVTSSLPPREEALAITQASHDSDEGEFVLMDPPVSEEDHQLLDVDMLWRPAAEEVALLPSHHNPSISVGNSTSILSLSKTNSKGASSPYHSEASHFAGKNIFDANPYEKAVEANMSSKPSVAGDAPPPPTTPSKERHDVTSTPSKERGTNPFSSNSTLSKVQIKTSTSICLIILSAGPFFGTPIAYLSHRSHSKHNAFSVCHPAFEARFRFPSHSQDSSSISNGTS